MAKDLKQEVIRIIELHLDGAYHITDETALIGPYGILDSIGLIGVIVDLQEELSVIGIDVDFTTDKAMSATTSPFRNLETLMDYINEHTDNGSK